MTRPAITIIIALTMTTIATGAEASRGTRNVAPGGEFSFQVESYGRVLPVYNHKGRSYIEGSYGSTYAIRVFNHTGGRVEAVVTVDGRDVVSGKVGSYTTERGYVIAPYSSVLIDGFRKSWNNVAAFTFTSVGDSYAARMGDASNVGVIGVAVFKEKVYRPVPRPLPPPPPYRYEQNLGSGYGRSRRSPAAPSTSDSAKSAPKRSGGSAYESAPSYDYDDNYAQGLGTEYGTDTYSPSSSTTFVRRGGRPNALLAMRYDDREGLYTLGVLPRPRPYYRRYPKPNPFPHSPEPVSFAPPPPPRWWE